MRFKGKVILITGGNSGIGLATARRVASEGAQVIITGRNSETLEQAKREIGAGITAIRSDVSDIREIESLFTTIRKNHDKIDGLFANAGVAKFAPIEQVTPEAFDETISINVKGVFFTIQKAIPLLKRGASVLINSSISGVKGTPTGSVYSASKAAVRSLARTFSAELIERGIRVNVVSPGPIETPIFSRKGGIPESIAKEFMQTLKTTSPMKRFGTADELAAAAAFLLSSDSSYILGADLVVDGGMSEL